jgi:hypothetical protein
MRTDPRMLGMLSYAHLEAPSRSTLLLVTGAAAA